MGVVCGWWLCRVVVLWCRGDIGVWGCWLGGCVVCCLLLSEWFVCVWDLWEVEMCMSVCVWSCLGLSGVSGLCLGVIWRCPGVGWMDVSGGGWVCLSWLGCDWGSSGVVRALARWMCRVLSGLV